MKIQLLNFGLKPEWYPARQHYNDAGADIFAPRQYLIEAGGTCRIPLGFGVCIPDGYMGLIYPRSGMASRARDLPLPPIDSGYRGEVHAILTNNSENVWIVNPGDRIGQLVIQPIVLADYVDALGEERGSGAFGSTGG